MFLKNVIDEYFFFLLQLQKKWKRNCIQNIKIRNIIFLILYFIFNLISLAIITYNWTIARVTLISDYFHMYYALIRTSLCTLDYYVLIAPNYRTNHYVYVYGFRVNLAQYNYRYLRYSFYTVSSKKIIITFSFVCICENTHFKLKMEFKKVLTFRKLFIIFLKSIYIYIIYGYT